MSLELRSPVFNTNQEIPIEFTEDGSNISPPLVWTGLPLGTKGLALVVDDPDAPRPQPFVHWIIGNIPASVSGLPAAIPQDPHPPVIDGAVQGRNSSNQIGYQGPAPPKGHGLHHYHFHLYALDQLLPLHDNMDQAALMTSMAGHILAEAQTVGTYERPAS